MKDMWFYGIAAICFLVLGYLFATKDAVISGIAFVVLAVLFGIRSFGKR
jgi:hypothetical protein